MDTTLKTGGGQFNDRGHNREVTALTRTITLGMIGHSRQGPESGDTAEQISSVKTEATVESQTGTVLMSLLSFMLMRQLAKRL